MHRSDDRKSALLTQATVGQNHEGNRGVLSYRDAPRNDVRFVPLLLRVRRDAEVGEHDYLPAPDDVRALLEILVALFWKDPAGWAGPPTE